MPRFLSPATAATTDRPSSATPLNVPRSTFQASTACLPTVSASLPMMQPPVKTSAVRASTYSPLIRLVPAARGGDAATAIIAAKTKARVIADLALGLYRIHSMSVGSYSRRSQSAFHIDDVAAGLQAGRASAFH